MRFLTISWPERSITRQVQSGLISVARAVIIRLLRDVHVFHVVPGLHQADVLHHCADQTTVEFQRSVLHFEPRSAPDLGAATWGSTLGLNHASASGADDGSPEGSVARRRVIPPAEHRLPTVSVGQPLPEPCGSRYSTVLEVSVSPFASLGDA